MSKVFQARLLYVVHRLSLAGNLGQQRMYDSLRLKYCWPHMAKDVYATGQDLEKFAMKKIW